jgi:ribulose 1,5-bisphosphate synthetase/thiazole synthase
LWRDGRLVFAVVVKDEVEYEEVLDEVEVEAEVTEDSVVLVTVVYETVVDGWIPFGETKICPKEMEMAIQIS